MDEMVFLSILSNPFDFYWGTSYLYLWGYPFIVLVSACLKIHSRHLHALLCRKFGPHSLNVAHYAVALQTHSQ